MTFSSCRIYGKAWNFLNLKHKLVLMLVSTCSLFCNLLPFRDGISSLCFSILFFIQGSTGVTFKDVAGIEEAVEELQEVIFCQAVFG